MRSASAILAALAAVASGCIELWMGYQTRPVSGSWSSPFFWIPLPIMLAASVVLLIAALAAIRSRAARYVALAANVLLVAWWAPVAVTGLRYHYAPPANSTEGLIFPFLLVIPAVLILASLPVQIMALGRKNSVV